MHDDHDPDLLIDRALRSYSDIEPDASLRSRIVTRVSEERPRSLRLWSLAALTAGAATFCLWICLVPQYPSPSRELGRPSSTPSTETAQKRVTQPNEVRAEIPAPSVEPHRHARLSDASRLRVPQPKEVRVGVLRFRSMRPSEDTAQLTPEERALLQFIADRPREARQLLATREEDRQPLPATPLQFAPVHIAPVQIADLPAPEPLHAN